MNEFSIPNRTNILNTQIPKVIGFMSKVNNKGGDLTKVCMRTVNIEHGDPANVSAIRSTHTYIGRHGITEYGTTEYDHPRLAVYAAGEHFQAGHKLMLYTLIHLHFKTFNGHYPPNMPFACHNSMKHLGDLTGASVLISSVLARTIPNTIRELPLQTIQANLYFEADRISEKKLPANAYGTFPSTKPSAGGRTPSPNVSS